MVSRNSLCEFLKIILLDFLFLFFLISYVTQTFHEDISVLACCIFAKSSQRRQLELLMVISLNLSEPGTCDSRNTAWSIPALRLLSRKTRTSTNCRHVVG